jgi:hypothetical protein
LQQCGRVCAPPQGKTERRKDGHIDDETLVVAKTIDGYLGHEFAKNEEGTIFMSYWQGDEAVST